MKNPLIEQFLKERKEALLSMDKEKILAYAQKWAIKNIPSDDETFWIAIHKARTGATDLSTKERIKSKQWLNERGYQSLDDGDLPNADQPTS